jgi:hypothetical protein
MDEPLYVACLQVASNVLTGITAALLLEIPLSKTLFQLTYNILICIMTAVVSIYIERNLQEY